MTVILCDNPTCTARVTIPEHVAPDGRTAFMFEHGWNRVEDGYICPRCERER